MPAKSCRSPQRAGRRAAEHALVQPRHLAARALRQLGVDPARQDRVHLDVVLRPGGRAGAARTARCRPCSPHRPARSGRREDRHHRADIDDLAAAGLLHVRIGRVRAHEGAGEVGVHHDDAIRSSLKHVGRLADVGAGIVDQDVELAVPRRTPSISARQESSLVTSTSANSALPPASAMPFTAPLGLLGVAPGEHHGRAGRREPLGHAEPDAAIAAGDDRDAAGQIEQAHALPPQ